jgi:SPP1 gp7 family putative phage head morphogenesis protein
MATTIRAAIKNNEWSGAALRPAVSIYQEFGDAVAREIAAMYRDVRKQMEEAFASGTLETAMDASVTSQARMRINEMRRKWYARFREVAKREVKRMLQRVTKNSQVTLGQSLRDISETLKIDTSLSDARLQEVIKASTQEAAGLIKRIPEQFLGDVQGQVMRSITSGRGMQDLVPYLAKKYEGDKRWARHVAMDQTRKAYSNVNAARLQKLGCESYIWIHSGGSAHPRQEHIDMNGKEFRFDDPPVIDKRTGQRGKPGDAIFCRCVMKPVFRFGDA